MDVAQARFEAALHSNRQYRCGRCEEEVAPAAMWCPHCGFDMTAGGATELKRRNVMHGESHLHRAGIRLLIGTAGALGVLLVYLLLSTHSATTGVVFGVIAFDVAMLSFAAELSVRGLLYSAPTMATTLLFLTIK
jgi:hypothetical protein